MTLMVTQLAPLRVREVSLRKAEMKSRNGVCAEAEAECELTIGESGANATLSVEIAKNPSACENEG